MRGLTYARLAKEERDHDGALLKYYSERRGEEEESKRRQRDGKQQPYGMLRMCFREQGPFSHKYL